MGVLVRRFGLHAKDIITTQMITRVRMVKFVRKVVANIRTYFILSDNTAVRKLQNKRRQLKSNNLYNQKEL